MGQKDKKKHILTLLQFLLISKIGGGGEGGVAMVITS